MARLSSTRGNGKVEPKPEPTPAKEQKSIKMTPGKQRQVEAALVLLIEHYSEAIAAWSRLTAAQREAVLQHSPLLAKLADVTAPLREDTR